MEHDVQLLIERLQTEKNKQIRNGVYGYTQRVMAYNSNKIEGSKLTKEQTNSLFETQTLKTDTEFVRAKDIEEATGHFIMFNTMLDNYTEELNEDLIKNYHYALKSGVFEDKANGFPVGEYKNRANIVSDMKTTSPLDVPKSMQDLLNDYNSKNIITLEDIAKFHARFEHIHPFQDGNGRIGRFIILKQCLEENIDLIAIDEEYEDEYKESLYIAQTTEDYSPLIEVFKKCQKRLDDKLSSLSSVIASLDVDSEI